MRALQCLCVVFYIDQVYMSEPIWWILKQILSSGNITGNQTVVCQKLFPSVTFRTRMLSGSFVLQFVLSLVSGKHRNAQQASSRNTAVTINCFCRVCLTTSLGIPVWRVWSLRSHQTRYSVISCVLFRRVPSTYLGQPNV